MIEENITACAVDAQCSVYLRSPRYYRGAAAATMHEQLIRHYQSWLIFSYISIAGHVRYLVEFVRVVWNRHNLTWGEAHAEEHTLLLQGPPEVDELTSLTGRQQQPLQSGETTQLREPHTAHPSYDSHCSGS